MDRRGLTRLPDRGLRRLSWLVLHGKTEVAEGILGAFAFIRGAFVLTHSTTSFPPLVYHALREVIPLEVWGLTGVVPGALQISALIVGSVRFRRWAAYSNVGVLWMIATLWSQVVPGQLGTVAYATLGTIQLYLALRLAAEPDQ